MLQLANVLHTHGFKITIIHTEYNSPNPSNYPHFTFKSIKEDFSEIADQIPTITDATYYLRYLNKSCVDPFRDYLSGLLAEETVACVITDAGFYFAQAVADDLKLPRIVLRTSSLGIIWNTFKELEESALETISQDFPIPSFPLGPFHKYFPASSSSLIEQDRTILSWLDKQSPKSVVYVSFGSVAHITESEFHEVAHGLANIGLPFLWVVRPGMVAGSEWLESLPEKFLERIGDRGRIVKWSPQQEVLAHPATGCFWTHGGWNSILESICEGVPMICSPCFGDQPINARYVSDVWKIGVLLEDGLERVGIEMGIKQVMMDKEGEKCARG
ncbi:hypothetical protein L1987_35201 [Smallanthus sonchifolius]|uniref:Uncharacterized protein n=1 Tax=Smallanthus sonchifolius TaxID=185202 RepID=A0ACB9HWP5_9ASTR|nr:hypothetical protein L1987_35201 [Smallanthus sonchifolius]